MADLRFHLLEGPPTVTNVSPLSVSAAGGTSVTITGTNLLGATAVTFGGVPAQSFFAETASEIIASCPTGTLGLADVIVTTPSGTSTAAAADQVTDVPAAGHHERASPASGPAGGGTQVTITGTGLSNATTVNFGDSQAAIVSNSATQIVAISPLGALGPVDIRVFSQLGATSVTAADQFTYVHSARCRRRSSRRLARSVRTAMAGGTLVTITAANLNNAFSVTWGGTSFPIISNTATQIVVSTPVEEEPSPTWLDGA